MAVMPDPKALEELTRAAKAGKMPPVETWQPTREGQIDMVIRRDGTWVHEGGVISRHKLARLFSTILRRDGDDFYLVTPAEKLLIEVEDAPFVAVDLDASEGAIRFTTNMGDTVTADADHPVRVERDPEGEPSPYVEVRHGLEARIDRKSFYRLVEMGETCPHEGEDWFGVVSDGVFFPLIPASELPD